MSYFSVFDFIKAGHRSLESENYWSALAVALTLPSMCSRLAFDDSTDKVHRQGERWKDRECYIDFCKIMVQHGTGQADPWVTSTLGENYAEVLYGLRCDIIHAGVANIYDDKKKIFLVLGKSAGSTDFDDYRTINVKDLCETIFEKVEMWCRCNSANNFRYTHVFDIDQSKSDRLLYEGLCDECRKEALVEKFHKEELEP